MCVIKSITKLCRATSNIIDAEVNVVCNSFAVIVPWIVVLPCTVKSPVVSNEPVISILPLMPVELYFVDESPICMALLAVNWLNWTFAVVATSCPIDIFCVNALEPSKPTPVLDIVTPVPCVNINELPTDIPNTSLNEVSTPDWLLSGASSVADNTLSVSSLIIIF